MPAQSENLKLDKLFKTAEELTKPEESDINGEIPQWLSGQFLRVGPGLFDFDSGVSMNYWIDGYCMLSKFSIKDQKVKFEKKFLQSDAYKKAQANQKPIITEFGTVGSIDKSKSLLSRIVTSLFPIELSDNDQINLYNIGKNIFASAETSFFREIDPCSLSSVEKYDSNKCFGLNMCSPHPITDSDGFTYNLGSTILTGAKYHIVKIPPAASNQKPRDLFKKSKTLVTIPSSNPGYLSFAHSFAITKNYIIVIEQPYVCSVSKAMAGAVFKDKAFKDFFEWKPEFGCKFHLIEKESGKCRKSIHMSKAYFFLHIINAYEENDQLIVDIMTYEDSSCLDALQLNKLREGQVDGPQPCAERFVLPLLNPSDLNGLCEDVELVEIKSTASAKRRGSQIQCCPETLTKRGIELPQIAPKIRGKKYNYFYATGAGAPGPFKNSICKMDVKKKEMKFWNNGENLYPGEPIFVPNPQGKSEDDGVVICAVSDCGQNGQALDFLVFLDAKTMVQVGCAKFKSHIPQAIHGLYLPSS